MARSDMLKENKKRQRGISYGRRLIQVKVSHRHRWLAFALVFFIIMVLVCWSVFQSRNALTCTSYSVHSDKITKPIRVVQLTDLHNSIFGKDNQRLIDLVKE